MLTLFFIICIVAIVFWSDDDWGDDPFAILAWVLAFLDAIAICITTGLLWDASYKIDSEIAMYEEENAIVEEKLENAIQIYMQYEKDIMIEVSPDTDTISLISLYPDLKSDKLVQSEIDAYIANNDKIKELKSQKLNKSTYKFLLFFGH